jgi:type IV pilus assembly protein PilC
MAKFTYKATNLEGKQLNGLLEAVDRTSALANLAKQGLHPLTLTLDGIGDKKSFLNLSLGSKKVKSDDLVLFTRQLSTMVGAGVPLLRALNTLQAQAEKPALRTVLTAVLKDVQGGMSLGDAFDKQPTAFSDVYVNMIRAGEAAGILDEILKRIAMQQEKNSSMKKKIKAAMSYPIVLMVITIGAFFGLMIFIVPRIATILTDLGGPGAKLPLLTQIMLAISGFMVDRWYVIVIVGVVVTVGLMRYLKTQKGRDNFHTLILKAPVISPVIRKVAVARFARTFASLMSAGVSVLEALRVTGRAIGNAAYEKELARAADEVKNGKQLSQVLANSKLFPPIIAQMLAVGEETGQTDTVLIKVADFYEEEVDATIASLSAIIEPVMIVIMGSLVGLIAASVMGPIASLSQNIKG